MANSEGMRTARLMVLLRDAILASERWSDVALRLGELGSNLEEIRSRLAPRIGFDPHNHTVHSDGFFTPTQLLWWCKATGLEALGITEHDMIHPALASAVDEAESLGLTLVPGMEYTINRLGAQTWRGLEVGLHFFPVRRFAEFLGSPEGIAFCRRFEATARAKSEQGWAALDAVNERLMAPRALEPIAREDLWIGAGSVDPVCAGTLTVLVLRRIFDSGRFELLEEFPDTRAIYTYMQANHLMPPAGGAPQTFDDLIALRRELGRHGIRSTITLNHPEEWLTKCGLRAPDGTPDLPGMRRLVLQMLLYAPDEAPISFIELYSSRNTPASRPLFEGLYAEIGEWRKRFLPQLSPVHAIASTDSHRISGFIDTAGRMQGWVPAEDFVIGIGPVDDAHPAGALVVPDGYPDAETLLELMERCAT